MIVITKQNKKAWTIISSMLSLVKTAKSELRKSLSEIFVENGIVYATDGRALIALKGYDLPDGILKVEKMKDRICLIPEESDIKKPSLSRITDKLNTDRQAEHFNINSDHEMGYAFFIHKFGIPFQFKYFKLLPKKTYIQGYSVKDNLTVPLQFDCEYTTDKTIHAGYYIMPIKFNM